MDYNRCVILLFDGARFDIFSDLLRDGSLPNIKKYVLAEGTYLKGYSSLCTTTGPAHIPFIYGAYPGSANVPGIRWFDKANLKQKIIGSSGMRSYVGLGSYSMGHDVSEDYKPLYEYFSRPIGICSSLDKNHAVRIKSHKRHRLQKALYYVYAHFTDRWEAADYSASRSVRKYLDNGNDFIFSVFPGIDEITHLSHPTHRKVLNQYLELDRLVDVMFRGLSKEQIRKTLLFIVSDHGLSRTHTHISLVNMSREAGYTPIYYPKIFKKKYDIAVMESGNSMTFIYFMEPEGRRPLFFDEMMGIDRSKNLINRLLNCEGIDFLAYRVSNSSVGIKSRSGEFTLDFSQSGIVELKGSGDDQWDIGKIGDSMSIGESLKLTMETDYPDLIAQMRQLFSSERTGDLVIFAKEGFDLRDKHEWPEHKSSHGSPLKEHMEVPVCTNIKLESRICKTVDVFPTILHRMGHDIPKNVDGQVIK